ncbi:MAG: hypothetical protein A3D74_01115 [Candidatus Levybacteria bacterium RIFCSPHIGHO2_02_FULL_37_13]|nr:MAG: hypothetical protein A3D74_01115 [Candidatus Levybacteria bacterium RIFCSPHIGHO2_02_FULL_37_13]
MAKEREPRELQQSVLDKVARELVERRDKGEIVIAGGIIDHRGFGSENVIFAVGPSSPLYDPEEINEFTKGLIKSTPHTQIQPFNLDRGGLTDIGILSFCEITGTYKTTRTYTNFVHPIDKQLMERVGIKFPEEAQIEREVELPRTTSVHVYPHPKLAEIAGNQMREAGFTHLVSGYFPTKSFKKIRENELKGQPFPAEDFQPPKRRGMH